MKQLREKIVLSGLFQKHFFPDPIIIGFLKEINRISVPVSPLFIPSHGIDKPLTLHQNFQTTSFH